MSENVSDAGASAQAEYERRLARDRDERRRRRPTTFAVAFGLALVGLLNVGSNPVIAWGFVAVAGIVLLSLIGTPDHVTAWRTGAEGEQRTARYLAPLEAEGFVILHDRRIPGGRANIDHIVIGPPGIYVVETKNFRGKLEIRGNEVSVAGRRRTGMIEEAKREALAVQVALADIIEAHGYVVTPVICVHRADLPWFRSDAGGVRIVSGRELVKRLRKRDLVLTALEVSELARLAEARLRRASDVVR